MFGARGQLGDQDNQSVQEQDVVVWYVAHLPHMAALGPAKWLTLGPTPQNSTLTTSCRLTWPLIKTQNAIPFPLRFIPWALYTRCRLP